MDFVTTQPLLTLALVLTAGFAGGFVAKRLRLPSVTGQIVAGVALGPAGLALFGSETIEGLKPLTEFALGLIALTVGAHLNFRRLRNAGRRLIYLLLAESLLVPAFVFLALRPLLGTDWTVAALMGALALSTAPATSIAVIAEARAKGVFVKTLIAAVALNNITCVFLFEFVRGTAQVALDPFASHEAVDLLMRPILQLLLSGGMGVFCGFLFTWATPLVVRWGRLPIASLLMILLTWGIAGAFGASPLLACLFLGITIVNLNPHNEHLTEKPFHHFEAAILAAFFTLAGLSLELKYLAPAGLIAATAFAARFAGKYLAAYGAMWIAGATSRVRRYLGLALIPQAGISVGLLLVIAQDPRFTTIRDLFLAVALTVVTLNEIIGPVFTRLSLHLSGEAGKDRTRLIDFLHEENIVTDFEAQTKEEAIKKLTDLLIHSNHLTVNREVLLQSILTRESEMSTCIGEGLALPHGVLEKGNRIVGAMGLNRKGLPFGTPDGKPLHCIIVLATPSHERARHLEVLAAIARAVTTNPAVQHALYGARTPSHAYEFLHTEEAEDFNYFLE